MTVKDYYARELVQAKGIILQYLPTAEMNAHLLTKPLNTKQFFKLVGKFVIWVRVAKFSIAIIW